MRNDWYRNKIEPGYSWYHTKLDVKWTTPDKVRAFRNGDVPPRHLLQRGHGEMGQHALWQCHFPCMDYECWPKERVTIYVDPFSGNAFEEAKMHDRNASPYICYPDATYWDAIGTFNGWADGTVRYSDLGAWVNLVEKQMAYDSKEYWSEYHERNRVPTLNEEAATYREARQRTARAYSRGPSRGPQRRGNARRR